MYGLIGKIKAVAGQRAALAKILIDGSGDGYFWKPRSRDFAYS
jgi:PhoPQ-activated pathogenicity-related protein